MPYRAWMRHDQIALQLYTLRRLAAVDLPGTLAAVADAGYRHVELAGLPETGPGELARRLARAVADRGLRLGYHNHAFEFAPLAGTTVWDVLLAELAPEVAIELDVYWAAAGGRDAVEVIRATADRVRLLHMKDRSGGSEPHDTPAGEGTLDFPAIVAAGRAVGVEWYVIEQDEPQDPIADVTRALGYLGSLAV